jgi:hypothetical protein
MPCIYAFSDKKDAHSFNKMGITRYKKVIKVLFLQILSVNTIYKS